ncbi:hypothetical protein [Mesomycoplasma ovipneumoniae]|uniref:hypothetical protein n=1 Tax=Mesomycoplasma ovipneumoniae TaxID=29562 RepID=UPI0028AA57C0|nr:hypothetical protein [Mesomycoplasma ovipneumoniae]MDW2861851.1 hypothetical protein [Mesomycoplasma ovipneumoniae]WNM14512.1 hypothetical protein RNL96_01620 [Mesomycoplasma ovipneumoniae]
MSIQILKNQTHLNRTSTNLTPNLDDIKTQINQDAPLILNRSLLEFLNKESELHFEKVY